MFKGAGTVTINTPTVRAALQEYFDRHYADGSSPSIGKIQAKVAYGQNADLENLTLDVSERSIKVTKHPDGTIVFDPPLPPVKVEDR